VAVSEILPELGNFLKSYPAMTTSPSKEGKVVLSGSFAFTATPPNHPPITDTYLLEIHVAKNFPTSLPYVYEVGKQIPRDDNHHVNWDGTLCLGSPLRLRWKLNSKPTLIGFAESCLVPYLYSISHKLQHGSFPFGELAHGEEGVVDDYVDLMALPSKEQVLYSLSLLGKKKRLANKKKCPCGCGKRLGGCRYHFHHIKLRKLGERSWFRHHLSTLGTGK
jgi:hypothetical protein